jgi:hypothetical protein
MLSHYRHFTQVIFALFSSKNALNYRSRRYHELSCYSFPGAPPPPLRARQTGNLGSTTMTFDSIVFPDIANGGLVGEF